MVEVLLCPAHADAFHHRPGAQVAQGGEGHDFLQFQCFEAYPQGRAGCGGQAAAQ
jgi:hypothetical protein